MKSIKQTLHIKAPVVEVWKALTDSKYIDGWGAGPSKMSTKAGSRFSLWGGEIWGKNIEIVPEKKLVQEWTEGDWKTPSIATFILKPEKDGTDIEFSHVDYPESEHDELEKGWGDFYWKPIQKYFSSNLT